jgi:CTP synthase
VQALFHAGYDIGSEVQIRWIESASLETGNVAEQFAGCDGIIIPGGFGERGIPGMINAARFARENNIPYLGVCLGMQIAVIEFARNVLGKEMANSTEFDKDTPDPVIHLMPDQHGNIPKGGTMRLGSYPCAISPGSSLAKAYGKSEVGERHRHRYEFNNNYRDAYRSAGMDIGGISPDGILVESVEISANDFFIGVQYHPEFKSRPNRSHPLFRAFTETAMRKKYGV